MRIIYLFSFILLVLHHAAAQQPIIWYYNHNAGLPGAEYKYSFVHMSDIHIGEGPDDYGTFGYIDTIGPGDIGRPAQRLRSSVNWINANYIEKGIRFVIVSGDITDSAEKSEFFKAKEILDDLEIPYIPSIGNHDVWPYIKGDSARQTDFPIGDSLMNEIFEDVYDGFASFADTWDDGTRLTRGWNAEGNTFAYLQNFVFSYKGYHYIFLDFNPRYPAYETFRPGPGIGPEAQLHDYPGGTLQWLKQTLENLPDKRDKNVFIISHHPPAKDFWAFINAFSIDELVKINNVLLPFRQHLGLWFAGHIHRNAQYNLAAWGQIPIMVVLEVEANKEQPNGAFRVVNVYDSDVVSGVKDNFRDGVIGIAPNPASSLVKVAYPAFIRGHSLLAVHAVDGKQMMQREDFLQTGILEFTVSGWAPGTYIIMLSNEGTIYTAPLVVK